MRVPEGSWKGSQRLERLRAEAAEAKKRRRIGESERRAKEVKCLICGKKVNKSGLFLYVVKAEEGEEEERGVCGKPKACLEKYNLGAELGDWKFGKALVLEGEED